MRGASVAIALCACLAGCASPSGARYAADSAASLPAGTSLRNAQGAIRNGSSTKADVVAALGKTTPIEFDSGFEVWVYRSGTSELVILFAPSGTVAKTRVRTPQAGVGL